MVDLTDACDILRKLEHAVESSECLGCKCQVDKKGFTEKKYERMYYTSGHCETCQIQKLMHPGEQ